MDTKWVAVDASALLATRSLTDFVAAATAILNEVPPEFREGAEIEFEAEEEYDFHYVTVTAGYYRPATPEESEGDLRAQIEAQEKEARRLRSIADDAERDLKRLRKLKA